MINNNKNNNIIDNNTTEYRMENLENKCAMLAASNEELNAKLKWYEEQFRLANQKRFGASSEKTDLDQLSIFNDAEKEADQTAIEPTVEEITYKRRKKVGQREKMLEDLPVEVIEYRLEGDEKDCPKCGEPLHEMSKETRRELKVVPAQVIVVEHVRFIYSCRNCEANDTTTPIITAAMPSPVLSGSLVSPSLMAFVMNRKFVEAIPLYRQEQQFSYFGVELSRQTLSNWMIHGSNDWLQILYHRMHEHLLKQDILHADETTLQVLNESGRAATTKSYMWLFRTGRVGPPIIMYEYQTTRAGKHPRRFLDGFKGYVHTDGYAGYNDIPNVKIVGCWAHARRYFDESLKAMPDKSTSSSVAAMEGLKYCNKLFEIERKLVDITDEDRYKQRLEQSKPVLDAFLVWLNIKSKQVLPKSAFGKAIAYCRNQWRKLERFLLDGRLEIDNNRAERSIKPFVIGRKNWLFSNTSKGATSSAIIYSIIETAKKNGLSPFPYLTYLFEQLPNIDVNNKEKLDAILPWSKDLPDNCRKPLKK
ncbi:IS66 family transposase [Clostridium sp.]|jgi:transposase|uniref:IS66 family transposase n=1 Tax=Clostridium sp. TaxID=1506 RepID=UPI0039C888EE